MTLQQVVWSPARTQQAGAHPPSPGYPLPQAFLSMDSVGSWVLGTLVCGQPCPSIPLTRGGFLQTFPEPSVSAFQKLRCPRPPQREGLLKEGECAILPCRGKWISASEGKPTRQESGGWQPAHRHVPCISC